MKKALILILVSILSINPAWGPVVLAQEASQSATLVVTPEPVSTPSAQPADNIYTISQDVVLGAVYKAPQNEKVTVTFSKLPNPSGKLTIKAIKLAAQQIQDTHALSDTAYDISSTMENGTFEYTLTLPTTKTDQVEVRASEDGQTFITLGGVTAQQDTLTITGLNHFTLFVVTTVLDFNAGVSTDTTVADVGGGDGSVTNTLTEAIDQSQTTGTTAQNFNNTNWVAQTFTVGSEGLLPKVRLSLKRAANTDGNVTVEIQEAFFGQPEGVVLATSSRPATDLTTAQADYDFVFSAPPEIFAGDILAIVVYRSGTGNLTNNYSWFRGIAGAGADQYLDGSRFTSNDSGATWVEQTAANPGTGDLRFSTFVRFFSASGTQTSDVLNTDSTLTKFSQISWTETVPVGTNITLAVRAATTTFLKNAVSPAWVLLGAANSPVSLSTFLPLTYQYFQWRATLLGTLTSTPTLNSVTVTYNRPPNTPTLSSPANSATTSDNTPDLSWTAAAPIDPDSGDTVTYQVQVDNNADFSSPEFNTSGISGTTTTVSPALSDGTYNWRVRSTDNQGASNSTGSFTASRTLTVATDVTPPTASWSSPASLQTVTGVAGLIVSASDATSGVASVAFSYRLASSTGSFTAIDTDLTSPYTAAWDTSGLAINTYTLRATILDNAGNIATVDRNVDVGAIISAQVSNTASFTSINVSWNTDKLTTGRVIYDTLSHPTLGDAPNYGYALTSGEFDTNPKATSHNIVIGGLSSGTLYYFRTISAGSPVTISEEKGAQTFSIPGAGPAPSNGGAAAAPAATTATTGQVLGVTTPAPITGIIQPVIFPESEEAKVEVEEVKAEEPEIGEVRGITTPTQPNLFTLILNFLQTILNFLLNLFKIPMPGIG